MSVCRIDELPQNIHLLVKSTLGEVHEIVIDNVVVEILCSDALEVTVDEPLQFRMVGIDCLDVEGSILMLAPGNADMGEFIVAGYLVVASQAVSHQNRAFLQPFVEEAGQAFHVRPAEVAYLSDAQSVEVHDTRDAHLLLRQSAYRHIVPSLMRLTGHDET